MTRPNTKPDSESPVDEVSEPVSGTDTVVIACKIPNGLVMRLNRPTESRIPVLGRPGEFIIDRIARPDLNTQFTLAGPYRGDVVTTVGGYALTTGIPRAFAEEWFKQNEEASFVTTKCVYMQDTEQRARDQAKEQAAVRSGYERMDISVSQVTRNGQIVTKQNDPRWPQAVNPNLTAAGTDRR